MTPAPLIRLADYVVQQLKQHGLDHAFLVTGGGAMHLNDAIGRQGMPYTCCHHEQACAIAAEAYARVTNKPGLVNVTSGPGAINALNGVFGAWVDSIPMLVISGQIKRETSLRSLHLIGKLRQFGDQEADVISMVEGITKYSAYIEDPKTIRYHLERAIHLCRTGRPGPCWIDIPLDVQGAPINPAELPAYDPAEDRFVSETPDLDAACDHIIQKIAAAQRPVVYAGSGIRLSGAYDRFLKWIDSIQIPVVTAWNSNDLLWDEHPLYAGRTGTLGNRAGNFSAQNADLVIVLGCRLNIRLISYNWKSFARDAYKIAVDIDAEEMRKPSCKFDYNIHANVADVIDRLLDRQYVPQEKHKTWINWCRKRVANYPATLPEYRQQESPINPYCFMDGLFQQLKENEVVVCANGTACVAAFQAAHIKPGQRLFHNSGCATMGYDFPAAIGASIARPGQRVICIAGDGSAMMNLQELQTISGGRFPIKIFLLNNNGYHSMRQTQRSFFSGNLVGCGPDSGVTFPDFEKVATAFGFRFLRADKLATLNSVISSALSGNDPVFCEIEIDPDQPFAPKLASRKLEDGRMISSPLEDMAPHLSREELKANMLIPLEGEGQ